MDLGLASVIAAAITSIAMITVALINAFKDVDRATWPLKNTIAERDERIDDLTKYILTLPGGNPDDA